MWGKVPAKKLRTDGTLTIDEPVVKRTRPTAVSTKCLTWLHIKLFYWKSNWLNDLLLSLGCSSVGQGRREQCKVPHCIDEKGACKNKARRFLYHRMHVTDIPSSKKLDGKRVPVPTSHHGWISGAEVELHGNHQRYFPLLGLCGIA